jgi:hypothetical protein
VEQLSGVTRDFSKINRVDGLVGDEEYAVGFIGYADAKKAFEAAKMRKCVEHNSGATPEFCVGYFWRCRRCTLRRTLDREAQVSVF